MSEGKVEITNDGLADNSEEKKVTDFLNNKENKDGVLALASTFIDYMGNKWFSAATLCRKTGMDRVQAIQKLQMCKLFGVAEVRVGNWRDGRQDLREPMWKITIGTEAKISALDGIIQYHKDALQDIELQRKSLVAELEKEKVSI